MDHRRSIFGKITDKAKYIANIAANAANYALKADESPPRRQRRLPGNPPGRAAKKPAAKRSKSAAH